ncbi:MAG: G5 domain-containing protein [Aeriscardovia sp.]|nr:G5 domain-containing protein [Aeriscardovia sp.]
MSVKPWSPGKYAKKRVLRIVVSAAVTIAVCCIGFVLNQRKAIALEVDGKTKEVVTYADSLPKFLKEQGIQVHTHDQAVSSSGYWLTNGDVVKVRRAYEVMVNIGGHLIPYWTLASSAEQLENYFLQNDKEAARISVNIPNVYNALTGGIDLNASGPIEVIAFGKDYSVKNGNQPAASILDSLGITITSNDLVSVQHEGAKTVLVVERVSYGTETQDVMTSYAVKTVEDPNAYVGTTVIEQKGSYGEQQQTLKVTYINGKPAASQLLSAKVLKQSQPEVIEVGTKAKPKPAPQKPAQTQKAEPEKKAASAPQEPAQKPKAASPAPEAKKSESDQKPAQTQKAEPKPAPAQPKTSSPAPAQSAPSSSSSQSSSQAAPATPAQTPQPSQSSQSGQASPQNSSSGSGSSASQSASSQAPAQSAPSSSSSQSSSQAAPATPAQTPQPSQSSSGSQNQAASQTEPASSSELSGELTPAEAQTFAAGVAEDQYGWGSTQFSCLVELWNRESGWMWDAENVYSGAYGIAQALPPSKMGTGWEYNAKVQIDWGLSYILERYGTPCGAWGHETTYGWY